MLSWDLQVDKLEKNDDVCIKMMDFAFKMMNSLLKMMKFDLK